MTEIFDFDLTIDAQVTESVSQMNKAIKALVPQFNELRKSVEAINHVIPLFIMRIDGFHNEYGNISGGARTSSGNSLMTSIANIANSYITGGRFNLIYTIGSEFSGALNQAASDARTVNKATQNAGAPIDQFSQIYGAMQIRGADQNAAMKSTERLYNTFNNILWGRDERGRNLLQDYGLDIASNTNGTADVPTTLTNMAKEFPQMAPQDQHQLINILKMDSSAIELLREGVQLTDLLAKSRQYGLTIDPQLNARLTELNIRTNELSMAWDGLKGKVSNKLYDVLFSDGTIADGIGGLTDMITYGPDNFSLMRTLGVTRGTDTDKMRRGYNDADFYQQLNFYEKTMLDFGLMTDGFRKKYQGHNEAKNATLTVSTVAMNSEVPEFNPEKDLFNFGSETENMWINNQLMDINAEEPYSLWPSVDPVYENISSNPVNLLSPIDAESAGNFNGSAIADVIATAMQNNRVQIELTLIDSRTGDTSLIQAQGGARIAHAMELGN
ncbi:coat protein [Yersinia similis]|uniref:Coat protein n=1 Tax=Yersinia similis TaxID=367190 RepID=A0ABN4CQG6_9GAMM|nr:hypothetical protein [Yersinia similis]AHK20528.1 coat protein [Yersinia similis]CFQ46408.1 putative bacteriophage coat protein [Yersinia similis]CNB25599.1 putative bacteriophage coat protein [Yersinia similis]